MQTQQMTIHTNCLRMGQQISQITNQISNIHISQVFNSTQGQYQTNNKPKGKQNI
jgi:hypothetical protein